VTLPQDTGLKRTLYFHFGKESDEFCTFIEINLTAIFVITEVC
jgi:hypothetical protein